MSDDTRQRIRRAGKAGIQNPELVWRICEEEGIPFYIACAFLMQETSGGRNVWGHDDTWMIGYPHVNRETYLVYKAHRDRFGSQGVGPMQLTFWSIQDEADQLGGCWIPEHNMRVGFRLLLSFRQSAPPGVRPWWYAAKRYNGAESYADRVIERMTEWKQIILEGEQ